jgi:hypothetical protein
MPSFRFVMMGLALLTVVVGCARSPSELKASSKPPYTFTVAENDRVVSSRIENYGNTCLAFTMLTGAGRIETENLPQENTYRISYKAYGALGTATQLTTEVQKINAKNTRVTVYIPEAMSNIAYQRIERAAKTGSVECSG